MKCKICDKEFQQTKHNRAYCSTKCRKKVEIQRRHWDAMKNYSGILLKADWDDLTPQQREYWRKKGERLLSELGQRP
jgi:hypothetical protein